MFRLARLAGVQFCDSCTEVTTATERARRHHERTVLHAPFDTPTSPNEGDPR